MQKIQIRQINDMSGNSYPIYDLMKYDSNISRWRSLTTYFRLEDAMKWNSGIEIEDTRGANNE